ncbi:hypothetical protein QMU90_003323 [Edwardsiella ictaluri]|nr:hypothetical protein [Edwardsiella ictaluri]
MITIIDENNLVTEDGVELVAKEEEKCYGCYFWGNGEAGDCIKAPCVKVRRKDVVAVIFVEKNPC